MQSLTAEWMEHLNETGSFKYYFFKYLFLNLINLSAILLGFYVLRVYCLVVSNKFFSKMSNKIMKAPVNTFFDTTPSGWILNRFSKDLTVTDNEFANNFYNTLECFLSLVFTLYVACLTSAWILLSVPVIVFIMTVYTKYYIRCYRDLT